MKSLSFVTGGWNFTVCDDEMRRTCSMHETVQSGNVNGIYGLRAVRVDGKIILK
jgi:hypothetical protein